MSDKPNQLQHKFRLVAAAPNHQDFLDLLEAMVVAASDVRHSIGPHDNLEVRVALGAYLQAAIDTIGRIRKNDSQSGDSSVEDDD